MEFDLEDGARFMVYEYDMFGASCFLLANYPGPSQIFRNLALEGALLHARNLADFFRDGAFHDDINAAHYFDETVGPSVDVLADDRVRLNKRLMHPSYRRASTAREWNVKAIHDAIVKAWFEFVKRLAAAHPERASWFETAESFSVGMLHNEWDPPWIEAESSLEWWKPDNLLEELDRLVNRSLE